MTKYQKGAKYEYKTMVEYKEKGYYCIRSAGSHGIVDIVAINPHLRIICLIQCKSGKIYKPEKERIMKDLKQFEGNYVVIGELK